VTDSHTIETLGPGDEDRIAQVCALLVSSFRELSPTWVPTVEAAREVVAAALDPGMFSRVLLAGGRVAGWVGARHDYGSLWELHPLVVDPTQRGHGYGRALVEDIERLVAAAGGLTLRASTSDESNRTSLYGRDLFGDPLGALRDLKVFDRLHPLGFWQRMGYTLVGVVPDAEGPGKPSIELAKRLTPPVPFNQ
jgi:GNAT superfamily N-acetyltransferase